MSRVAFGCAMFVLALAGVLAAPAAAQAGACTATMNGTNVDSFSTPDSALPVAKNGSITVLGRHSTTPQAFGYKIQLELGGVKWTVGKGATNGTEYTDTVSVAKYATRGAGIYKVIGASSGGGSECFKRAYVKVDGDGPLSTTAGQVAVVGLFSGVLAVGAATVRARPITEEAVGDAVGNFLEDRGKEDAAAAQPPESDFYSEELDREEAMAQISVGNVTPERIAKVCAGAFLLGAALTLRAAATDSLHHVATMVTRWMR